MSTFLSTKLLGLRKVYDAGTLKPDKGGLNFIGCTITVDDATNRINVQVGGAGSTATFGDVTCDNITVADTAQVSSLVVVAGAQVSGGLSADAFALLNAVSDTRVQDGFTWTPTAGDWLIDKDGFWTNATTGARLSVGLDLPDGVTLNSVAVTVNPAPSHGALPGSMPVLTVRRVSASGAATIATVTDSSANVGAYETAHTILAQSLNTTVARATNRYLVTLTAESGANALAGLTLALVTATWTRPAGSNVGRD